ncbi:hypothetical protein AM587_10008067 [Phytophthora nicotianae]|uniref:Uncharacterized protein n=1 Tax=Phytophthora nicotianae TaxID=4792 RepID=A0A0W8C614_PHYNI|nr:hypothetical protein AM587_10008067 [Phytophthora nicotianae]
MLVVPLQVTQQHENEENSAVTVQSKADGKRIQSRDDAEHFYELQLAQPLPTFELNKTLVSKLLPSTQHDRLCDIMHRFLNSFLVRLFRVSLLCFGCLLFVPTKYITPGIPFMVTAIVLPPVVFVTFFSLDVLVLLACQYEFWFITALNTLNWVGLGMIFGDIRAISCFGLWLSSQSVVLIDANYRTFQTAVKSIVISGPFLILLVVCCSYNLIADASYPAIEMGILTLQSRQIVVFTASTLSVFVVKKAYTKNYRMRIRLHDRERDPDTAQGLHTIPPVDIVSNLQKLRLSPHDPLTVDARNVVLRGTLLKWMATPYAQSVVYITGIVGLSATAIVWIMILCHQHKSSPDQLKLGISIVAGVCSLAFTFVAFALTQRDLLRLVA